MWPIYASQRDDLFDVPLSGEVVACHSLDDAVAVKAADDILSGNDLTSYPADYLERLVGVLLRYGRTRAACLVSGSVIGLLSHCLCQIGLENRDVQMTVDAGFRAEQDATNS